MNRLAVSDRTQSLTVYVFVSLTVAITAKPRLSSALTGCTIFKRVGQAEMVHKRPFQGAQRGALAASRKQLPIYQGTTECAFVNNSDRTIEALTTDT